MTVKQSTERLVGTIHSWRLAPTMMVPLLVAAATISCNNSDPDSVPELGRSTPNRATVNEAAAEIKKLGGEITFDKDSPDKQVVSVGIYKIEGADAALEHIGKLTSLKELAVTSTQVTNAGLVHLKGLTNLQVLYLDTPKVTDTGLMHLEGLTDLESLGLESPLVTDAGLAHLKGLTSACPKSQ